VVAAALDYDRLAADYARNRAVDPAVLAALASVPATRVLEVGCGSGNYAGALAATGRAVVGLEPSAAMLARAPAALARVRGRAEVLPFAPASFDLVFSVDVIHHVGDRGRFFAEAARVLGPGGTLLTVTESQAILRARDPHARFFPETVAVELARYPAIATLTKEMAAAGLAEIAETTTEHPYRLTDARAFADKAFSSLHLIGEAAFARGLARLRAALAAGPLPCTARYTLLWAQR